MGNGSWDPGEPPAGAGDVRRAAAEGDRGQPAGAHHSHPTMSDPDVVLQIPHLRVDDVCVEGDDVDAHVSLRARLGSLLQVDVGVRARLGTARVDVRGVTTEAMLEVRLEGDFDDVHTDGDNASVLPTDTMRSAAYALSFDEPNEELEAFALRYTDYLLGASPAATK